MSPRREIYLQVVTATLAFIVAAGCKSTHSRVNVSGVDAPTATGDWQTTLSGVLKIQFENGSMGSGAYLMGSAGQIGILTVGHVVTNGQSGKMALFSFERPLFKDGSTSQYRVQSAYAVGQDNLYDYALITFPDQSILDRTVAVTPLELSARGVAPYDFVLYTGYGINDRGTFGSLRFGTNYIHIADFNDNPNAIYGTEPSYGGKRCADSICSEYDSVRGNTVPQPHDGALTNRGDSGAPILKMEDGQLRIVGLNESGKVWLPNNQPINAKGINVHRTKANYLPIWLAAIGIDFTPSGYDSNGNPRRPSVIRKQVKLLLPKIKAFFRQTAVSKVRIRSVYSGATGHVIVVGDPATDVPSNIEPGGLDVTDTDADGSAADDAGAAGSSDAGDSPGAQSAAKPAGESGDGGQGGSSRSGDHGR